MMDKQSYLDKCQELPLKDENTYKKLKRDRTSNYQDKFKEALWDLKVHGVIPDKMHHDLFPTTDQPPPPPPASMGSQKYIRPPCLYGPSVLSRTGLPST